MDNKTYYLKEMLNYFSEKSKWYFIYIYIYIYKVVWILIGLANNHLTLLTLYFATDENSMLIKIDLSIQLMLIDFNGSLIRIILIN